jgi:hypothetical protein
MAYRTLILPRSLLTTASGTVHERAGRSFSGLFRTPLIAVLLAVSYYLGTLLGIALKPTYTSMATFWPPSAILLAAFLLAPVHMWWVFLLAVHLLNALGVDLSKDRQHGVGPVISDVDINS